MSKALGSRLTQLRESLGLTKSEVARRLHVGNTTYSNWEYGLREPNADMIVTLADFFNVSTDYLLGRGTGALEVREPVARYDLGEDDPLSYRGVELPDDLKSYYRSMAETYIRKRKNSVHE